MKGEFLTTNVAARSSGVARETIARWCRDGDIVCEKHGRHWTVDATSLFDFVANHTPKSDPVEHQAITLTGASRSSSKHPELSALWEHRWDDRVLCGFGEWLASAGLSDDDAAYAVAGVWSYYSYAIVPTVLAYPPMAVSAKRDEPTAKTWLHLPLEFSNRHLRASEIMKLRQSFARQLRMPAAMRLSFHLDVVGTATSLADEIERLCARTHRVFLGMYEDNLEAELAKVIRPDRVRSWLDEPNDAFGGKPPHLLIRDPKQDHLIRDLIMGVKYGAVA